MLLIKLSYYNPTHTSFLGETRNSEMNLFLLLGMNSGDYKTGNDSLLSLSSPSFPFFLPSGSVLRIHYQLGVMGHTFNPNIEEVKAGRFL